MELVRLVDCCRASEVRDVDKSEKGPGSCRRVAPSVDDSRPPTTTIAEQLFPFQLIGRAMQDSCTNRITVLRINQRKVVDLSHSRGGEVGLR
jgi:hypothetical protein